MRREKDLTGGFSSLGEFLVAVRKHTDRERVDSRLNDLQWKTLTEGVDSGGGFLVPEKWVKEIYHAVIEHAIVRSRAIVQPMTSDTLNIPTLVDTSRSSNVFGGITLTWAEEAADKTGTTSDPKFGQRKLVAKEGVAFCWVQNQLEDDTEAFEQYMKTAFGRAIAFYEDDIFITGNGVGQPLGVMNSGAMVTVTRTAINKVDSVDLGNMAARLLPGSWATAVWLVNQSILPQWFDMNATGANVSSVVDLSTMVCFGRPIIVTEKCSALNTTGDIVLADFNNGYLIGDRSMVIEGSRHANSGGTSGFFQNQTGWRVVLRVDGQPLLSAPITPLRGGSTLSNFVCLTTNS